MGEPERVLDVEQLVLIRAVEEFLYREAEILDERRFEEWLDLLADDVRYWMPLRRNVPSGELERAETRQADEISWFEEGKATLAQRVQQLRTGFHWAEEPVSRTCHVVANVRIVAIAPDEVTVRSRFVMYRNRIEAETALFVGKREDVLRRVGGGFKLLRRKILLDQDVMQAKNLTTFL